MREKKIKSYYDFGPVLSRNSAIVMVMGARGLGKSYGAKRLAIRNWVRKGDEFIYLRRFKPELKTRDTFFNDIAWEFPEYDFRVNGNVAEGKLKTDENWSIMGYFAALSVAQSYKSTPFPKVTVAIFDEFIIEKGATRYLDNEVTKLLDFYSTVDRYDDRLRLLMLSNSVSIMNPYFARWKIAPDHEFNMRGDGFICAHFVDSEAFRNEVARTRFGKFVMNYDEGYAAYSIDNKFADNYDDFVMKKTGNAEYLLTLRTKTGTFSMWEDGPTMFIQSKRPKVERLFTLSGVELREGETMLPKNNKLLAAMRGAYRKGHVFFSDPPTRNAFRDIFEQ